MADRIPFTELLCAIVDNRGRSCPTAETGIPLIATNCIRNDLLYPAFDNIRFVSEETYHTWFRGHPLPGDFIFVCKGSPGRVCLAPDPVGFCIAQDMVAVRADPKKVYPKFLFASLRSAGVQEQISNMHVGTLKPHLKKGDFDKLLFDIPDEATQRRVGDIYFELSMKIDLNRRMNETLEELARALFKSWFVDFDPVKAKAEGRQPVGMDAETAALFPSRFVESKLGRIPEGWTATNWGGISTLEYGKRLIAGTSGSTPVFGTSGQLGWAEVEPLCSEPGIVVGRKGAYRGIHFSDSPFFVIDTAFYVKRRDRLSYRWAYYALRQHNINSIDGGSAIPSTSRAAFYALRVVQAPESIQMRFTEVLKPAWARQVANQKEASTLAQLRDLLLQAHVRRAPRPQR
ncbi:MAG: restriction endonuclease subunit S [Myxococcales bacterium]